jgi:hypothetical protein
MTERTGLRPRGPARGGSRLNVTPMPDPVGCVVAQATTTPVANIAQRTEGTQ